MGMTSAIWGGLTFGAFMAISVGPTLFAVIRYSLNHSYRAGLAFVLGVSVSDILYVTLANLAAPVLQYLHNHRLALAYSGGALLVIMGLTGMLKKYKPQRPSKELVTVSNRQYFRIAASGFLINTINPGVVINWIGAVTVIADEGMLYRIIFFSVCLGLVLGVDFLKVILADSIRKRLTLRLVMQLQRLSALIILLFGLSMIGIARFRPDWLLKEEKKKRPDRKEVAFFYKMNAAETGAQPYF